MQNMVTKTRKTVAQTFRIKAVARMTGISPDLIRAWERRYGLVVPHRTAGGNRVYTREDISRLALVKRLVDAGDRISTVAGLSVDQLEDRLATHEVQQPERMRAGTATACRVAVVGDVIPTLLIWLPSRRTVPTARAAVPTTPPCTVFSIQRRRLHAR